MDSMLPAETGTNLPPTMEDLKAIRTPSFRQSWGPSYFAKGRLETPKDVEEFSEHMGGLIPSLDTWENEIQDITIDENALKVRNFLFFFLLRSVGILDLSRDLMEERTGT